MNMFVSTAAIVAVPTTAPASPQTSDRRALEAYASWLFMERRILCGELWPDMGAEAERYDYYDNAGAGWHFRGDGDWRGWLDRGGAPRSGESYERRRAVA